MIQSVSARVLTSEWAPTVIPAPYDSLTPHERAQQLADNPNSFAHVAGSPPDAFGHPSEHRKHADSSARALGRLIELGAYLPAGPPSLYVQRIEADGHVQHALLGVVDLEEHELRPHEDTQPDRVHALAAHFAVVGRMSSPVVATAPNLNSVSGVIAATLGATNAASPLEPLLDTETTDGARITLWPAVSPSQISIDPPGPLYIVDGHHRVTAARQAGFTQVLVALVPACDLHLGSFDRELSQLDTMPRRVVDLLDTRCDVVAVSDAAAARPTEPGWIGFGVAGHWFRLRRRDADAWAGATSGTNPASRLDATFVHDFVLAEVFGITSASDPKIAYRPTSVAIADAPVTVMLAPVPLNTVFDVADFGGVMPPKTTYFLPKARSGVLLVRC